MNAPAPEPTSSLGRTVTRLATLLWAPAVSSGERAALRRWALGQPLPLAFYRLWLSHVDTTLPPEHQTEAWMLLFWAIATLGAQGHHPHRPWGQALAEGGFAEGRLERLLAAPEDVRGELFTSTVRFLAAKGEGFDLTEAARFLLTTDPGKREALYRQLAQAYYRHLPRND